MAIHRMDKRDKYLKLQKAANLSNSQVASLYDADLSTVKRWRNGQLDVPESVIIALSYQVKYGSDYEVELSQISLGDPSRLTRKVILDAVCEKTGIKSEFVGLERFSGDGATRYVWQGKVGSCLLSCETFSTMNAVSLSQWMDDFEFRLNEWHRETYYADEQDAKKLGSKMNGYIESIDWNVDFE